MSAANFARNATRSLRIIALPLAPPRNVNGKALEQLTYYHFVTQTDSKKSNGWTKWAVAKASDAWAGLGKAEEGTWKVCTFFYRQLSRVLRIDVPLRKRHLDNCEVLSVDTVSWSLLGLAPN